MSGNERKVEFDANAVPCTNAGPPPAAGSISAQRTQFTVPPPGLHETVWAMNRWPLRYWTPSGRQSLACSFAELPDWGESTGKPPVTPVPVFRFTVPSSVKVLVPTGSVQR